jgi:hypothetical protein
MRRAIARTTVVLLLVLVAPASPGFAEPIGDAVWVALPVTPEQARQLATLLQAPDRIEAEAVSVASELVEPLAGLPRALVHDILTAPSRHLAIAEALVADTLALGPWLEGRRAPVLRHTVQALHRSATLSSAAGLVSRLTRPGNEATRLVVVVTLRAHGIPAEVRDLDLLRQYLLRAESADLAPLLAEASRRLAAVYGREAVRLLLTR